MDADAMQALAQAINSTPTSTVSIKLPEFWPEDPEVWFVRIESQFALRGITKDETMFDYVVSALDNNTATEIKAVLLSPPPTEKYKTIKEALVSTFSKSQTEKDQELLSLSGLGDKKPTTLLRKIRNLNNDADTLRRAIFLNLLPIETRAVLAGQNISDLDELAQAADRIMEVKQFGCASVVSDTQEVNKVSARIKSSGNNFQNKFQDWKKNWKQVPGGLCAFHSFFGETARKCEAPCSIPGNAKASRR